MRAFSTWRASLKGNAGIEAAYQGGNSCTIAGRVLAFCCPATNAPFRAGDQCEDCYNSAVGEIVPVRRSFQGVNGYEVEGSGDAVRGRHVGGSGQVFHRPALCRNVGGPHIGRWASRLRRSLVIEINARWKVLFVKIGTATVFTSVR